MSNMQVEDRIAEKLKSSEFGQWFGEDDLHNLVKRGIEKAFFTDRIEGTGYQATKKPPRIVQYAEEHLAEIIAAQVNTIIQKKIEADPELLEAALAKAVQMSVDDLIIGAIGRAMEKQFAQVGFQIENRIRDMFTPR